MLALRVLENVEVRSELWTLWLNCGRPEFESSPAVQN
jgi:hypothetical protein